MKAKRWFFLLHRWLGVLLCAFFVLWFISGVVMMYVGYPKLTPAERLAHLPLLNETPIALEPAQALEAVGLHGQPLQELRLAVAREGRPVYFVTPAQHGPRAPLVVDANTGAVLSQVTAQQAQASAAAYASIPPVSIQYEGLVQEDAFTHSRALDSHRPLHRVRLDDAQDTLLYVSSTTGEVVRDAPHSERLGSYVGTWLHWLYPLRGGVFQPYWADIVNTLAILGTLLTLLGLVVGVLRWRSGTQGRYRNGRRTPYPSATMRWHHIAGLCFGGVTLTWIFSGLMSMNPWRIFDSAAPALRTEAMHAGPLVLSAQPARLRDLLAAAPAQVRELRWLRTAGYSLVQAHTPDEPPLLLHALTAQPHTWPAAALEQAAARLIAAPIERIDILTAYDLHYYRRAEHTMTGGSEKPLPVLRVVFADAAATWVHIDPHTGSVVGRTDYLRRASRWWFAMLHSWDWLTLLEHRPLWDGLMLVLSAGGLALSGTGVLIGGRRLALKYAARVPKHAGPPPARLRPRWDVREWYARHPPDVPPSQ